jgi:deoxyribodipyrimidine photo-lyase
VRIIKSWGQCLDPRLRGDDGNSEEEAWVNELERLSTDPRVTVLRAGMPDPVGRCVVYWMQRAQRARDNPALNVAIDAANALAQPLLVFFRLSSKVMGANARHYRFMLEGLCELPDALARRNARLVLRCEPDTADGFCNEVSASLLVSDDDPLRRPQEGRRAVAARLRIPFWLVDADVIVPSRLLRKEQYAARTIRPRIHALLPQFLVPLPNRSARVAWPKRRAIVSERVDLSLLERLPVDRSVPIVSSFHGGASQARRVLQTFLSKRLAQYAEDRNEPAVDGTSQLSPYLRFGQIGPHTVVLAVRKADAPARDRDAFLEQLIVRRELSVNFVRFNPGYDRIANAESWAERTLAAHARDARQHRYTFAQFEHAETHDPLWNAAQQQMVISGWMHNYLRMYWAKKILEWSATPAEAYETAVILNDRYELDGREPNGYAGIAWAIAGKHDRAWGPERPIYGTVRYMSYASTSRKFDSKGYVARVNALVKGRSA